MVVRQYVPTVVILRVEEVSPVFQIKLPEEVTGCNVSGNDLAQMVESIPLFFITCTLIVSV